MRPAFVRITPTQLPMPKSNDPSAMTRTLQDLTAAVERMQAGDLTTRLPETGETAEVVALVRTLNRLADTWQPREAERRQVEGRFRAAFESSAIGMGLLTLDGRIMAANAAVCEMSGYTEEELQQIGRAHV